ncbi:MAG: MSCRAMM family protein, partial [Terriglobales bacterium]
ANTEAVGGISRSFRLNKHSELIPNLYYFHALSDHSPGRNGAVGSLVFRFKASEEFQYSVELGVSRGVGGAGQLRFSNDSNQLHAEFRSTPLNFAGLGINQMPGQNAQADYTRRITGRLAANVTFSRWSYDLPGGASASMTTSELLRYTLARHWNVNGGVSASRFTAPTTTAGAISSVTLPVGVDFATARFGAGAAYQQQIGASSVASGQRQVRGNARVSIGAVQVSGFVSQQANTPTLQSVVAPNSPLSESVGTESVLANSPDAVASGLHDNLILAGLGYVKNVGLAIATSRLQYGASVNWIGHGTGHDQFSYNFLASNDSLPTGNMDYSSHSVAYTRRITDNNDISVAFSLVSVAMGGKAAYHPRFQIDARHRFTTVPSFFAPGSHGLIAGRVFQDDSATGEYNDKASGIADVEVVLDGERHTRTDTRGLYAFDHVAAGSHEIEAIPHLSSPYYFTTSSTQAAEINSRVNFGVAFSAGQVFGYIRNDARSPIGSVVVHIRNASGEITVRSDDNGRFERRSLPQGAYEVWIDPMSLPAGYALAGLARGTVKVTSAGASEWDADLKAIRSIGGKIVAYDRNKGRDIGVSGAVVVLRELSCAVVTDKNGNYRFKELPAGNYTVAVVYQGREHTSAVSIGEGPELVRDANINVGTK